MLPMMDGFVLVWIVVVFLALAFGLVNTLVMAVFERVREIGLMLALGMTPAQHPGPDHRRVHVPPAGLGLLVGDVLAWLTIRAAREAASTSPSSARAWRCSGPPPCSTPPFRWQDVVLANVVVLVLGFIASLSPAWRASRYEPVEAITKV